MTEQPASETSGMNRTSLISLWLLSTIVTAAISISLTLALSADDSSDSPPKAGHTSSSSPSTDAADDAAPAPVVLHKGDFFLKVKIKSQECFGSAGCNVTYQVKPVYLGSADLSTGAWDITYRVSGAEDPIVNTMTLQDGTFSFDAEEIAQTSSSNFSLTARVTSVESTDYSSE